MNALAQFSTAFQTDFSNYASHADNISSLPSSGTQLRVPSHNSLWVRELGSRLNELTSLPRGWDGYEGLPVSFRCADFAANLIERLYVDGVDAPQLVPGADGTVQIEWHMNHLDIEIDILAPYKVMATRYDHLTGAEEELELGTDFTRLAIWVAMLGDDRSALRAAAN
ncbi:hypothetical protein JCM17846_18660 [Iodidimonas nitroreducens]|uniref:Uncharacterized protein n=1 Tax=Iodidimonas nitroreducens TaxID=1236968 RepID=A0A5A7N8U6_9PROT|nr:hypothetical protein [Iodidimonas nitroreducens]GAK33237.1 hypothetical protein AQ1_01124 [alpha proteobacterium Q-1]GER04184.1 hypothetical protein JCM17846_18660 [Iodidimonas nitroreducens]